MARDDWFRRTTWSAADAKEFFARLKRSRPSSKAQYLRIQAHTLAETRQDALSRVALELLQQLFAEFPESPELASAHLQAARCQDKLGDIQSALSHFRLSLEALAKRPNHDPGTALEYPWFVARRELEDEYDAALDVLKRAHLAFPIQALKAAAIRALIASARGDRQAAQYAQEALDAAGLRQSSFRYHRGLGLVGEEYAPYIRHLQSLVAA